MHRAGFWCMLFGALAFLLPQLGVQHVVFVWLGDAANPVAIALIVAGAVLFGVGTARARAKAAAAARDAKPKS